MTADNHIEPRYHAMMNDLAQALDTFFNGTGTLRDRQTAFVLLCCPFDDVEGRVNYISNGERADIVAMLKHILARFEGQPDVRGRA